MDKIKLCCQMRFTSTIQMQNRAFRVDDSVRTTAKCTSLKTLVQGVQLQCFSLLTGGTNCGRYFFAVGDTVA